MRKVAGMRCVFASMHIIENSYRPYALVKKYKGIGMAENHNENLMVSPYAKSIISQGSGFLLPILRVRIETTSFYLKGKI
ncbi:hypothetical protein O5O45_19205 [Hahella aquimaris]|uniref:hypothetical protein n=1 Tax=Hahella sp. HNIBRBA332 TaxID=3015983 RepID=UPI00273B6B63|nr:hypothetical protein [Hahella sp. HNIBRBA332]WLQ11860.1 hypothetical protein O5O45_19205 [Hahella sp. HNIBRBA332]